MSTKNESLPELPAKWLARLPVGAKDDDYSQGYEDALRHAASDLQAALTHEAPRAGVGLIDAFMKKWGWLILSRVEHDFRDDLNGLVTPTTQPPHHDRGEAFRHVANEWADMACNGLQWLRNIRDGLSTVDDALAEMEANVKRIRALTEAEYMQRTAALTEAKK